MYLPNGRFRRPCGVCLSSLHISYTTVHFFVSFTNLCHVGFKKFSKTKVGTINGHSCTNYHEIPHICSQLP